MTTVKQIVLIPHWIQETLWRKNLSLAACLDLDKLIPLISMSDMACYAALQSYFKHIIGTEEPDWLYSNWCDSIAENNAVTLNYRDTVIQLANDGSVSKELYSRLFDVSSKVSQYEEPFKVYDLAPKVCGVVIYPGFFLEKPDLALQKSLIEAILKVLYIYDAYHDVAKTSSFKRYLELLSSK